MSMIVKGKKTYRVVVTDGKTGEKIADFTTDTMIAAGVNAPKDNGKTPITVVYLGITENLMLMINFITNTILANFYQITKKEMQKNGVVEGLEPDWNFENSDKEKYMN